MWVHLRAFKVALVTLDPIHYLLVSDRECLDIGASLSISCTTPCCMVLVYSYCSLSLTHFLSMVSNSLFFLSWHILSVDCHRAWHFGICSLIRLISLHSSPIMGSIFHSLVDLLIYIFNPIFSLQKGERHVFIFTPFLRGSPLSPYHFSLWSSGWKWIRDILL